MVDRALQNFLFGMLTRQKHITEALKLVARVYWVIVMVLLGVCYGVLGYIKCYYAIVSVFLLVARVLGYIKHYNAAANVWWMVARVLLRLSGWLPGPKARSQNLSSCQHICL